MKTKLRQLLLLVVACGLWLANSEKVAGQSAFTNRSVAAAPVQQSGGNRQGGLDVRLPLEQNSVRFAVIGDSGTGDREQYEVAKQMEAYRQAVKFDFVIMLGDNIYGSHSPEDFVKKFEQPYKPMLDAGVKFFASLGNHDDPNEAKNFPPASSIGL